jgi:hypothetical protein
MRWSLVACALALACPANAATLAAASVEEAARTSDAVARGRVLARAARWEGGRIVTDVEIAVSEAWKGAPGGRVRVRVPGGVVGTIGQHVAGAPRFSEREEVVVFLARGRGGWRVNGLALGKFRVDGGLATPALEGIRAAPAPARAGERPVGPMALDELRRRVRAAGP